MDLRNHPFFRMIDLASEVQKKAKEHYGPNSQAAMYWGVGRNGGKSELLLALRAAHPFVFDKGVTTEKILSGRGMIDFSNFVEDFSLPFKTTLYLMTGSPSLHAPLEGSDEQAMFTLCGYLIQERDPEHFMVWQVSEMECEGKILPYINQFTIDLKAFQLGIKMAEAMDFEIFNKTTEAHVFKETCSIFHFTNSISVKRIGIEHGCSMSIKNKSASTGFTVVKYDNIYHVADKVEYHYKKPSEGNKEINWEYSGWRRGHWRAFYVHDGEEKRKDSRGWNVVDYGRIGKNRQGEYNVSGYTWVIETCLGDKSIAEIKTRVVKHKR